LVTILKLPNYKETKNKRNGFAQTEVYYMKIEVINFSLKAVLNCNYKT